MRILTAPSLDSIVPPECFSSAMVPQTRAEHTGATVATDGDDAAGPVFTGHLGSDFGCGGQVGAGRTAGHEALDAGEESRGCKRLFGFDAFDAIGKRGVEYPGHDRRWQMLESF